MDILDSQDAQIILEAALLSAQQPMTMREMRTLFDNALSAEAVRALLPPLVERWQDRGVALSESAEGWRFQTRPQVQPFLERLHPEKPPKYSRATMETLAIIAYKQPVTRGDIEDIRGVTVSSQIVKQLEDRGWIEVIGHRDAPGRPGLYATTAQFLSDFSMQTLQQLPDLNGLGGAQTLLPGLGDALAGALDAIDAAVPALHSGSEDDQQPSLPLSEGDSATDADFPATCAPVDEALVTMPVADAETSIDLIDPPSP